MQEEGFKDPQSAKDAIVKRQIGDENFNTITKQKDEIAGQISTAKKKNEDQRKRARTLFGTLKTGPLGDSSVANIFSRGLSGK
jgi:hypothetical protein